MEIKEIARQLCNLPDGEYKVKSKTGDIEIINQKFDEGRSVVCEVEIRCNNQNYMKITSIPSKSIISERRLITKDDKVYFLTQDFNNNNNNYITCVENEQTFRIDRSKIVNDSSKKEYIIYNGIITYRPGNNESIAISYNFDSNEKLLYLIKKNGKNNIRPISLNPDFVQIKKEVRNVIDEYNNIIESANKLVLSSIENNEKLKKYRNELTELISSAIMPTINVGKIDELDREITLASRVYKKYASKLNQPYSVNMTEVLNNITETLTKQYCNISVESKKNKKFTKIFEISKFLNK